MAGLKKLNLKSKNITEMQKAKLKELFPEVFTEDKIDFDQLRLTLGGEVDDSEERFGMTWPGKRDCFKVIQESSIGTLKPCRDESVNWDKTENLFIEGDNLEALKLLQKSYYGKIKMIYIDPPYNTGNEFIYPDKYSESLETYLAYTGQVDAEGRKFSTNTEADGRFHSKWLNMIYPRLFLARNLLRDDGVIFISIDDNEMKNLRALCDEIFGEENIISQFVWRSRLGKGGTANQVANIHEYVIVYAKSAEKIEFRRDVKISAGGRERLRQWGQGDRREDRPSMYYPITGPNGVNVFPIKPDGTDGRWRIGKEKMEILLSEGLVEFEKRDYGLYEAYRTIEAGRETFSAVDSILSNENASTTAGGSKELKALFEGEQYYDYPKPSKLIEYLVGLCLAKDAVILDFFSGSCTTAHAVLKLNKRDNGRRKFILVQLPEPCEENSEAFKAGYKNIADIGKERISRVIKKIQDDLDNEDPISPPKPDIDLGFKVFKLDKSNFKIWDGNIAHKPIQEQLKLAIDHIDPNSKEEDILYEILLKSGFELTTPVEKLTVEGKKVYSVAEGKKVYSVAEGKKVYSVAEGALLICLEKNLTKNLIRAIAEKEPHRVVCLDSGFKGNDQLKTNAVQIMKSFKVESFRTV